MSGEVLPYTCRAREGKAKYLTHQNRIKQMVFNHLNLDLDNYVVSLLHDDDDEKLQEEHNQRIQKWIEQGKFVSEESRILPGLYDESAIISFKIHRDKNRYYQDGSIVRALVKEFNLKKCWDELGKLDKEDT